MSTTPLMFFLFRSDRFSSDMKLISRLGCVSAFNVFQKSLEIGFAPQSKLRTGTLMRPRVKRKSPVELFSAYCSVSVPVQYSIAQINSFTFVEPWIVKRLSASMLQVPLGLKPVPARARAATTMVIIRFITFRFNCLKGSRIRCQDPACLFLSESYY